ncbi:MAG: hypothetical protein HY559_02470 [Gammaproteobacteria bacterium]|nr:hypothetical protein [Gammaproteobacteria bacterium]
MSQKFFNYFDLSTPLGQFHSAFLESHRQFLLETPYNSAYAFYHQYISPSVPGNLGNNCIALSILARKLFCKPHNKYLYLVSGRHHPLLYHEEETGNLIFLDPYLMHQYPICMNQIFNNSNKVFDYPVFPVGENNRMQLSFNPTLQCIHQTKFLSNGTIKFNYYLNDAVYSDPNPYEEKLLYHNEQDTLSIRVIDASLKHTVHLVCVLKTALINPKNHQLYTICNGIISQERQEGFSNDLKTIAKTVNLTPKEIIHFFKKSVVAYMANLPHDLKFEREPNSNPSNL